MIEALRGARKAHELFVATAGSDRRLEKLLKLAAEKRVVVRQRDKQDITRLCGIDYHQGVALRIEPFDYLELNDLIEGWRATGEPGLFLVLDGIQDPHNLGALIRSAACAGGHGVIIPKDRAVGVTATVEKTSAGAVETIPIVQATNIIQVLDELKKHGFWIYGAVGDKSETIYHQDFTGNIVFVVGGEGKGIRPLVQSKCDVLVSIPILGGVDSLNASVAAGVVLFEAVRQRFLYGIKVLSLDVGSKMNSDANKRSPKACQF